MANIETSNDWPAGVYQYADGDVLDGGADSSEVLPLKQLANRSLYQRLANVTAWDSSLATAFGYPNKAVVMHDGLSWRAKVANAVEPGTDPTKWERWGYSQSEIEAMLDSYVPAGMMSYFPTPSAPSGWLKANGAAVSRTAYAKLFAQYGTWFGVGDGSTTFSLPDLRGEFMRGFDDSRGVDVGRVIRSWQRETSVPSRVGNFGIDPYRGTVGAHDADSSTLDPAWSVAYTASQTGSGAGDMFLGVRPRNVAWLACVKY